MCNQAWIQKGDFFLRQIKPPDVQEKYMIGEKETTEQK
jgi:hypothetical protein